MAAKSHTKLRSGGDDNSSKKYQIYLYPNDIDARNSCNDEVLDGNTNGGLEKYCEKLLSNLDIIDYYEILIYEANLGLPDSSIDEFQQEFQNWWYDSDYDQMEGSHLGVTSEVTGGFATGPTDPQHESTFISPRWGVASTAYSGDDRVGQHFAHECMHGAVNRKLPDVESLIENGSDHDLGTIHRDLYDQGPASPLLGGYKDEYWADGECSEPSGLLVNGYTIRFTDCEKTGLEKTANHDYN